MEFKTLADQIEALEHQTYKGHPLDRVRALEAANRLQTQLETPWEALIRIVWLQVNTCSTYN